MGYSPRSPHSQHCPTAIFLSASTISNKKKPSPSTELLCGADEIRTRAGVRFHIHVTPWHSAWLPVWFLAWFPARHSAQHSAQHSARFPARLPVWFPAWHSAWLPARHSAWLPAWFPARKPGPFVGDNVLVLSNLSICLWEIFPIDKCLSH